MSPPLSSGSTGTLQGCRTFEWGRGGGWLGRPLSLFTCMQTDASSRTSSVSMDTKGSVYLQIRLLGQERGLNKTPVSLRTQPCSSSLCYSRIKAPASPSGLRKVANRPAGLNPLDQKEKPGALSPQKDSGVSVF